MASKVTTLKQLVERGGRVFPLRFNGDFLSGGEVARLSPWANDNLKHPAAELLLTVLYDQYVWKARTPSSFGAHSDSALPLNSCRLSARPCLCEPESGTLWSVVFACFSIHSAIFLSFGFMRERITLRRTQSVTPAALALRRLGGAQLAARGQLGGANQRRRTVQARRHSVGRERKRFIKSARCRTQRAVLP